VREFVAVDVGAGGGAAPEHLTLRFLGEVDAERNGSICSALEPVARRHNPFALRLEGIGAFPSRDRPRVVWLGVTRGREEIVALARDVRAALETEFGSEEGEFVPHLTWFRVRSRADRAMADELFLGTRPTPAPREVSVDRFVLKESRLGPRGATHRTVQEFRLAGTPDSGSGPTAGD
jgi:RNA 2',3'-cyclic 3'-phosphodiesterase